MFLLKRLLTKYNTIIRSIALNDQNANFELLLKKLQFF